MYKLAIKNVHAHPSSPEVENFQMKIYYPAGDRNPDQLNRRHTCYHLSQRGERSLYLMYSVKISVVLKYSSIIV